MKTLWARIGMSVDVTNEEYAEAKALLNDDKVVEAREMLLNLFLIRGYLNGDSYMPSNDCAGCDDNPNEIELDLMGD